MRWDEAKKYMTGWSFAATEDDCYPAYIWTNKRIFFVHEYDGSILLMDLPRHPTDGMAHYIGMM